jgi:translation initiation factor IF-2
MEKPRQAIVTVLGHVDHGKTTLLDAIRKTSIAQKEAGGITQSIGASVVSTNEGKKITFIDTPGHAAFSKMRSRGAAVADIAMLVVAADGGVKHQTKEALRYILDAKIPYIVVANKMDLPSASVEKVKKQLEKEGVVFEGDGGDVPIVPVSAKTGKGIKDLLEMVVLVSELKGIKADPQGALEAVVIETNKDKRGPVASVLVRNGSLRVGLEITAEEARCKVRGLFDYRGQAIKEVRPGEPCQVLGFSDLPLVGSQVKLAEGKDLRVREKTEEKYKKDIKKGQLPVVLKAKSAGCLEALLASIPEGVVVIAAGVGDVHESDVFLAKSSDKARVFAFESKVSPGVLKLGVTEGVKIERFEVIYEFLDRLDELLKEGQSEVLGKAEVTATFPFDDKQIAGCKVISGKISKSDKLLLMRRQEELGEVKAVSMKKQKQNITEAKLGEEFGIIFKPQLDFELGDVLISVRNKKKRIK